MKLRKNAPTRGLVAVVWQDLLDFFIFCLGVGRMVRFLSELASACYRLKAASDYGKEGMPCHCCSAFGNCIGGPYTSRSHQSGTWMPQGAVRPSLLAYLKIRTDSRQESVASLDVLGGASQVQASSILARVPQSVMAPEQESSAWPSS